MPSALAFSAAGLGVPEPCGGLAGPIAPGALGVAYSPAAAHPERGEWLIDAGWTYSSLYFELDEAPNEPQASSGGAVAPSICGAEPIGDFGLGLAFFPLIARGGGEAAPEDAFRRYYSIEGAIQVLEVDLWVAWQPSPRWTVGVGPRIGLASLRSRKAIDSGALIGAIAGLSAEDSPVGQDFLEGTQTLIDHSGTGWGVGAGVRYTADSGPAVDFSFRTPLWTRVRGDLELIPSNDLELVITADVETEFPFPPAAFLGVSLPVGPATAVMEVGWLGWSSMQSYPSYVEGFEIASEDETMQAILDSYDITEAEFLESSGGSTIYTGMRDVFNTGLAVIAPLGEAWDVRAGIWNFPAAVPDYYAHPSNLDFHAINLRGGAAWAGASWLTLGFTGDYNYVLDRDIEDSAHAFTDPSEGGALVPPGTGEYRLKLARLGLTVIFHHGKTSGN